MKRNEKRHAVFLYKKIWNWKEMVIKMQDKNRVFGQSGGREIKPANLRGKGLTV